MLSTDTVTIKIPACKNKDDLNIACQAAASEARERGHYATAKSYDELARFINDNNEYSDEDKKILGLT